MIARTPSVRTVGAGIVLFTLSLVIAACAARAEEPQSEPRSLRLLVCGGRTAIVAISPEHPEGLVEWSHPAGSREGWVLPDGNVLLAISKGPKSPGGAAVEIRRGGSGGADEVVWRYEGTQAEVNSIQKTPEGTYVLTEAGANPRLLEIAADGTVKTEFPLSCQKQNPHMQARMARKQADGTFLVPHLLDFAIKRYDATGKVLATIDTHAADDPKAQAWPFTAIALPDGGILASLTMGQRVVEFGADGTVRWQVSTADTAGAINDACGIQRLPGGNTMIASYRVGKDGVKLLEVTPDRTVAWAWKPAGPGIHHFHVFEIDGKPVPSPALR
jgi:hypothetical protein